MCGIAGVFTLTRGPSIADAAAVLRMLQAQTHRGPDDWGLLVPDALIGADGFARRLETGRQEHLQTYAGGGRPGVVLGARRLSILDLSPHGRMPMGSADSERWVAHNGEIYNFRELRDDLGGTGASFRSRSDTEVILRGHETWGDDVVRRLRGMFAFAIFEAAPRPRLAARPRSTRDQADLLPPRLATVWSSRPRCGLLLSSGLVPEEPNPEAIVRFLQLGSVPSPITTVKDIVSLPPAHCLTVEGGDVADPRRYWSLADVAGRRSASGDPERIGDAGERTGALLEESVALAPRERRAARRVPQWRDRLLGPGRGGEPNARDALDHAVRRLRRGRLQRGALCAAGRKSATGPTTGRSPSGR